jgi:peroxiredoxin
MFHQFKMNNTMKMFLRVGLITTLASSIAMAEVVVGKAAPDFSVKDVTGKTQQLSELKGKLVVLENYNLDCPYVLNHYKDGAMQELQAEAVAKGAVWLVVNSSYKEADKAVKEQTSQKIKATAVIHDPSGVIGKAYGFKTTPHMVILNKDGTVAYNGAIDDRPSADGNPREANNYVRAALKQLTAGEAVTKPQTKPYGCGAKYAR